MAAILGGPRPALGAIGGGFGLVATGGPGGFGTGDGLAELGSGVAGFFHGVAEPLEGTMPGKTETGLADAFAATELNDGFGADGLASGVGRGRAGGGGGAGAALGGTSSR